MNDRLGSLRRYILVITSVRAAGGRVCVLFFTNGQWYYIDGADEISQKNFNLIALFLTMMAIPSAVPQVTPTISVPVADLFFSDVYSDLKAASRASI